MFDQKFEYLSADGGEQPFNSATGDSPQQIAGLTAKPISFIMKRPYAAIITAGAHGLSVGDIVYLDIKEANSPETIAKYRKYWTVIAVQKNRVFSKVHDIFVINESAVRGETISGTWQLASSLACPYGQHKDSNNVCVPDIILTCPDGFHKNLQGGCVADEITCGTGEKLVEGSCLPNTGGAKVPPWAIYLGLAVVAGLLGWVAIKGLKPKADV
jgi:LPXTG-motif cell wall-anchored protein